MCDRALRPHDFVPLTELWDSGRDVTLSHQYQWITNSCAPPHKINFLWVRALNKKYKLLSHQHSTRKTSFALRFLQKNWHKRVRMRKKDKFRHIANKLLFETRDKTTWKSFIYIMVAHIFHKLCPAFRIYFLRDGATGCLVTLLLHRWRLA